ncbi:MAG TPA: NUDIX domain-containing protein [Longimicrobiales bacterium]
MKQSVALEIHDDTGPERILLVQRPDDDEDLPGGVWGLPAASLTAREGWEAAARRAAREKLGLEVEPGRVLNEGSRQRAAYRIDMRLYEATIRSGTPELDGPLSAGTTRYQDWRWGTVDDLRPAAEQGSLCARLALEQQMT